MRRLGRVAGALVAAFVLGVATGGCAGPNPDYDPARSHHRPNGFVNLDGEPGGRGLGAFVRWQWARLAGERAPARLAPAEVVEPDLAAIAARAGNPQAVPAATWLGHSTVLVQVRGVTVLTDPVFSGRASPVSFAGPARQVAPPLDAVRLPRIDLVLISHDHYDHLDLASVRALAAQPGGSPVFAAPLGVHRWLRAQGIERVEAFDWWDGRRIAGLDIHLVPARHWSARTPFDRNTRLWGGWVVRTPDDAPAPFALWFAGDTGWTDAFAEIGRRLGPFDLALIPVGAFEPRWFMAPQHIDPDEAVRAMLAARARHAIAIHWDTFRMADEPADAPRRLLPQARARHGVAADDFVLLRHGETWTLPDGKRPAGAAPARGAE